MKISLISSVNQRRYGKSSQGSPKITSGNLQQSLHQAPPPSATIKFPPLLTTPSSLFLTLPTPTPILTPQTTSTTPTPLHQPQPLSPLSHPPYCPNNHAVKRQKPCLHHFHSLHHKDLDHHIHQHVHTYHLAQETMFRKNKTIRTDHLPKEKPTHT